MQNTELSHLYKSFKSIFPTAHIVIIDHTGSVIMACENRCLIPQTEQYSGFKEILTVHAPTGGTFYKLSFPLPLSNQLFLYIPSKDIEDVLTAAKMADSVIQLFLSRPSQSVQSVRQSDTMLLLDHLFHPSTAEEDTYTALLAAELGFDMSLPRAVCIFRIEQDLKNPASKISSTRSILQTIHNFAASSGSQDIIGAFGNSELILCHVMGAESDKDIKLLENIYTYINKNYFVSCCIGVGLTVTDIGHYCDSFISAQAVFRYAQNRPDREKQIYYVDDFLAEHLVYEIPEHFFEHFFKNELNYVKATPIAQETIGALVACNMDISMAAEALFIHRNTMVFRLNQLKKQLNLNPFHKDNDRFKLILLYHYFTKKYNANHSSGEMP